MFKKKKIEFTDNAKNLNDTIDHGFICAKWFLVHHFKKTVIAILILLGGAIYVIMDYVQMTVKHKARIERNIKP
jgi:hypothetical protein